MAEAFSVDALKSMVYEKAKAKGLEWLWPLIDFIVSKESGWNPSVQSSATDPNTGQRENSWGLFQNLISSSMGGGLGAGFTPQQLQDPELNAEIALEHIRRQLAQGVPLQQAVDDWTVTHGIDVNQLVQGGEAMADTTTTGAPIQDWVRDFLEKKYDDLFKRATAPGPMGGGMSENQALNQLGTKEDYVLNEAGMMAQTMGPEIVYSPEAEAMTPYEEATIDMGWFDRKLAEAESIPGSFEMKATWFANELGRAGTVTDRAAQMQAMEQEAYERRAPAPNAPGGFKVPGLSTLEKYGGAVIPVRPSTVPEPSAIWEQAEQGVPQQGPAPQAGQAAPQGIPFTGEATFTQQGASPLAQAAANILYGGAPAAPGAVQKAIQPQMFGPGAPTPAATVPPAVQQEPPGGWQSSLPPEILQYLQRYGQLPPTSTPYGQGGY